jgi:hypothetical protein
VKLVLAVLALPLAACEEGYARDPKPLASFADLSVGIWASSDEVVIGIGYDDGASGCSGLSSSFEATIGGVAIPIESYGGTDDGVCDTPILRLPHPPAVAPADLVIGDDSLSIHAVVEDALLPRNAQLPSTLAQDQNVTIDWSPAPDLTKYTPQVWLLRDDLVWFFDSTVADSHLAFSVLPSHPLPPGNATLEIIMDEPPLDPFACSNARCTFSTERKVSQPITVQ